MKKQLIAASLILGLAGCAATPDLPAGYTPNEARQEGVAIVSLTLGGKPLNRMESFIYRLRAVPPRDTAHAAVTHYYDSPRQHARSIWASDQDRPFTRAIVVKGLDNSEPLDIRASGEPAGRVAILRLTPGEYEIHTWRLREPVTGGTAEYAPPRDFSYRFNIKAGEAVYLGRLDLRFDGHNIQRLALEDRRAEDIALVGRKHPALSADKIVSAVGAL